MFDKKFYAEWHPACAYCELARDKPYLCGDPKSKCHTHNSEIGRPGRTRGDIGVAPRRGHDQG
jgi:hypothetical protein